MMSSKKITLGGIFSLSPLPLTTRQLRWMIVKKLAIQAAAKAGLPMLMQQQMSRTISGPGFASLVMVQTWPKNSCLASFYGLKCYARARKISTLDQSFHKNAKKLQTKSGVYCNVNLTVLLNYFWRENSNIENTKSRNLNFGAKIQKVIRYK